MTLREYIQKLDVQNNLCHIQKPISKTLEISGFLKQMEPAPVFFHQVCESQFPVIGNLFCSKKGFADYFNIKVSEIIPFLASAIQNPKKCEITTNAPCQEVILDDPDLDLLPILFHCHRDGGNYISSGIVIAGHPVHGQNADFHRCMQISKTSMAMRVVRNRHFDQFLRDRQAVDVAICIGNAPNVLAAAATSVALGVNELEIANALEPLQLTKAKTSNLLIPADSEFVLEGTVYLNMTHPEGPFVDLTETYDIIRQEPVFEIKTITHRKDAIWQALLPGALEHKLLMGMPREPTIFRSVNQVAHCLDVNVNPGGCSWLHAIVQIDKKTAEDGQKAIEAAFAGHSSLKHVYIVDNDIDIYNPQEIEWAMATRFQGDWDMHVLPKAPGSSLDPSADPQTHATTRIGFDLTKPLQSLGKSFDKVQFPIVDIEKL